MPTNPLHFISVRYPAVWSVVLALLLLIALFASLPLAKPVLATSELPRALSTQFTSSELSTTYIITG